MTATSPPASVTKFNRPQAPPPASIHFDSSSCNCREGHTAMEGVVKGHLQVPAFGCWNQQYPCDGLPIGQYYFDSSELFRGHFNVSAAGPGREKDDGGGGKQKQKQQRQQRAVWRRRAGKAVDEDLYQVPPEILHQKPKRRLLKNLWGCMRVSSIDMD